MPIYSVTAIELKQVNISDTITSINTSNFSEWTPPFISAQVPLHDLRKLLLLNGSTFNIIVDVFRNVSDILPEGTDGCNG